MDKLSFRRIRSVCNITLAGIISSQNFQNLETGPSGSCQKKKVYPHLNIIISQQFI